MDQAEITPAVVQTHTTSIVAPTLAVAPTATLTTVPPEVNTTSAVDTLVSAPVSTGKAN